MSAAERYRRLTKALEGVRLPAAVVDLDALEANVAHLAEPVAAEGKTLRMATKSIRCVELIRRIQAAAPEVMRGLMCYSAAEARFLFEQGLDDLLLAYPTVQASDVELLARLARSAKLSVAVDDEVHIETLGRAARRAETEVTVILDVDASWRPLGSHVGVRRSPLLTIQSAVALADRVRDTDGVRFGGVLVYEAQVAGLGDANPFAPLLNPAKRLLRRTSMKDVARKRAALLEALEAAGHAVALFNGGGSGSLSWAVREPALTEVTAGSGFLDSHLFDYFSNLELRPALYFALQITRRPGPRYVTCHGGGYVASGEAGKDRLPIPVLPEGLHLLGREGAGEVQTPLRIPPGIRLEIGAPVFFRHAKTGELAEHFETYILVRGAECLGEAKTYRGEGQRF